MFNGVVNSFAIDASGDLYAGITFTGVLRSSDNGANWTEVTIGLTNTFVEALAINASGDVFAGTDGSGVFRSTDKGANWTEINVGFTSTSVLALVINAKIDITAHVQQARDTQTSAAVISEAAIGWDQYDSPEAPVIGEYVSVYFPHPEWGQATAFFTTDARPEPIDGETWEFEVRTNIHDIVELDFSGVENVPPSFDIWLLDETLQISKNLKESSGYSFTGLEEAQPKHLKLVVGNSAFIDHKFGDLLLLPPSFQLDQNFPNPFNPSTTIRFGLPVASGVTLRIYNLIGKEVRTLMKQERLGAGYHLAIWDGTNESGQQVASGVYLYELLVGQSRITKKMIFLK